MATERPLIVLAGPIHPDGKAVLEKEARVVVCEDESPPVRLRPRRDPRHRLARDLLEAVEEPRVQVV